MFWFTKYIVLSSALCLLILFQACGLWQAGNRSADLTSRVADEASDIPFLTKEPQVFQATVEVSAFSWDGKSVRKYFVARNKEKSLLRLDFGKPNETALLNTGSRSYILDSKTRTYKQRGSGISENDDPARSLTRGWLYRRSRADFEKLETTDRITRYRVKPEDGENPEIYVFFDEKLELPIRQDMYSILSGKKELTFRFEISGFQTETDDALFELPANYRAVER